MDIVCQNMELFSIVPASRSRHSPNQLSVRYILNVKFNQMARNLFPVVSGVFGLSFFYCRLIYYFRWINFTLWRREGTQNAQTQKKITRNYANIDSILGFSGQTNETLTICAKKNNIAQSLFILIFSHSIISFELHFEIPLHCSTATFLSMAIKLIFCSDHKNHCPKSYNGATPIAISSQWGRYTLKSRRNREEKKIHNNMHLQIQI